MYWGAGTDCGGYDRRPLRRCPVSHEHVVTMDLQELIAEIVAFRDERDWPWTWRGVIETPRQS